MAATLTADDYGTLRMPTPHGLTVRDLRHLIAGLPDGMPVRVEDTSRPGPVPGSTAVHPITHAAANALDDDGTDVVLLLVEPRED